MISRPAPCPLCGGSPVVVQTSVRASGVGAELAVDAVGPVSIARRVFIASPYAGAIARNERYARACMADSLTRGEAPFVPHLLYTQVLPEDGGVGRQRGLDAALAQLAGQDLLAVYEDLGVSSGMAGEIDRAARLGMPVERRRIGWVDSPPKCPECKGRGEIVRGSMLAGEAWEDPCPRCHGRGALP